MDILSISSDWSFWSGEIPRSVARQVELPEELTDSLCLVVQGVRRCGKSTLLGQMIRRYGLDPAHCAFLNFEDPRLATSLSYELLDLWTAAFERLYPGRRLHFFLDEVQAVKGWQRWLRSRLDQRRGHSFVITGSNATLLSGELSTALTGRHLRVELFPFSWDESRAHRPSLTLPQYLRHGGFPEPQRMAGGDSLRRQYFDDIVERDVRERIGARSSRPLRQLAQMVFEAAGSELSVRRVAAATGVAVDTASKYLEACESAYLLFSVPFFAYSERKRAARNRKYYPIDPGLRRAVITRTGLDEGKDLECATYLALRRRHRDIFYWRGKHEVDFVVLDNGRAVPYQVSLHGREERHQRALDEFYERHPHAAECVWVTQESFPLIA